MSLDREAVTHLGPVEAARPDSRGGDVTVLQGNMVLEPGEYELVDAGDVIEDLGCLANSIPRVWRDVVVNTKRRASVLDFLDKVPQEQGADPFVTPLEKLASVVEDHLEQGCEGGLEIGDVGQVELDTLTLEELVIGSVGRLVGLLESRVALDHRFGMGTVGSSMLRFLAHEEVGLLGHFRIGEARVRLTGGRDDVALKGDGKERKGIAEKPEAGVSRLPLERHRVVDLEADVPHRQVCHTAHLYIYMPNCKGNGRPRSRHDERTHPRRHPRSARPIRRAPALAF